MSYCLDYESTHFAIGVPMAAAAAADHRSRREVKCTRDEEEDEEELELAWAINLVHHLKPSSLTSISEWTAAATAAAAGFRE